ncbi:hypothetical protein [Nocardioides lentus]|uniref:hypothetical protein n=1 Tax=Nocardioides lentus TaxID=338077 RepID=UPI0031D0F3A1
MSTWHGFLDDLRPVDAAPLDSPYVGARAVRDTDLPSLDPGAAPVRVVLTGGAAQLAGPVALGERRGLTIGALDTALRDPGDLAGNARRVVAAYWDAGLADDALLHVRLPSDWSPSAGRALDLLAEVEAVVVALAVADQADGPWVTEVLDRELRVSLVGGDAERAVVLAERHGRSSVVSWLTDDPVTAVTHLEGRP